MPSLYKRILTITWPLVLSNLAVPLLGLADSMMLGHLDEAVYLAAAALGASLITLIFASLNFLRMSTTGLSAQAFGQHNQEQQSRSLIQGILLALILAFILLALSPWLIQIGLALMIGDAGSQLHALAKDYCQIRFYAAPATLLNFVLVGWAIGQQNSRLAMLSLTSTTLINIVLDYIFIIHWDWQTAGSAWATVIAEYSSLMLCSIYLLKRYTWLRQKSASHWQLWHPAQRNNLTRLLKLNSDLFIRSSCLLLTFAFFNAQGARLGELVLAANAILLQLIMVQSYALDGFANAAEALVGENLNKPQQRQRVYRATALCSLITALMLVMTYIAIAPWIASSFTEQQDLIEYINRYLNWIIFLPLISVWSYWLDGVAVGLTASRAMRNCLLLSTFAIFLPCWWLTQSMGNNGLWLSFFVFSGARGLLLLPLVLKPATSMQIN